MEDKAIAVDVDVNGVNRNAAEPVDVAGLHVRNVGYMKSGDVDDFINTYNQPPLSKFLCLVSQDCKGLPDLRDLSFITQSNDEYYADDGSDPIRNVTEWNVAEYFLRETQMFLFKYLDIFYQNFNATMMHFDTFYYRNKMGF